VLNASPEARDDVLYYTSVNTVLADNLLANDFDVEGNTLTAALVGPAPDNGQLVLNSNGTFTFTPDQGFQGTAKWKYQASDGNSLSRIAKVQVLVGLHISEATERGDVASDNPLHTGAQTLVQDLGHGKQLYFRTDQQGSAVFRVDAFVSPSIPTPNQITAELTVGTMSPVTVHYDPDSIPGVFGANNRLRFAIQVDEIAMGYRAWTMKVTMSGNGWTIEREFQC
jgi:hypothetical protein